MLVVDLNSDWIERCEGFGGEELVINLFGLMFFKYSRILWALYYSPPQLVIWLMLLYLYYYFLRLVWKYLHGHLVYDS